MNDLAVYCAGIAAGKTDVVDLTSTIYDKVLVCQATQSQADNKYLSEYADDDGDYGAERGYTLNDDEYEELAHDQSLGLLREIFVINQKPFYLIENSEVINNITGVIVCGVGSSCARGNKDNTVTDEGGVLSGSNESGDEDLADPERRTSDRGALSPVNPGFTFPKGESDYKKLLLSQYNGDNQYLYITSNGCSNKPPECLPNGILNVIKENIKEKNGQIFISQNAVDLLALEGTSIPSHAVKRPSYHNHIPDLFPKYITRDETVAKDEAFELLEIRALLELKHPNIITLVCGIGIISNNNVFRPMLVFEYGGMNLDALCYRAKEQQMVIVNKVQIVQQVAEAAIPAQ